MTRYKIYCYDGGCSRYIKTLDDDKVDINKELEKMNSEYSEEELIKGYGYYSEKERVYR